MMLRKLMSLFVGLSTGIAAAVAFVTLFSPINGEELRENIRDHYHNSLDEARKAKVKKREELLRDLDDMRSR
jgi:gas vesicle protein